MDFVLSNVQLALQARRATPWAQAVPWEIFLNDVLPYASITEEVDKWREPFFRRLMPLVAEAKSTAEAAQILNTRIWALWGIKYAPNQVF